MNPFVLDVLRNSLDRFYRLSQTVSPWGWAPPPLYYHLLLTYQCNIHCDFCFLHFDDQTQPVAYLSEAWIGDLLDRIPWFSNLSFSGGEPFCHPNLFSILARACRSHRVSLVTNSTLLNHQGCRDLVRMAPGRFGKPGMTLLGISMFESPGESSFEAAFEKKRFVLEMLHKEKRLSRSSLPIVELKIVIRPDIIHQLDSFLLFLRENLADVITFQVYSDLNYPIYYDGLRHRDPQTGDLHPPVLSQHKFFSDIELLSRQIDLLLSSPERRQNRIRFYPETTRDELIRYLTGQPMKDRYSCVFPWMGMGISPLGNASLCRTSQFENLTDKHVLKAWNSSNFRSFRRRVLRDSNLAESCPGCCFLMRRSPGNPFAPRGSKP